MTIHELIVVLSIFIGSIVGAIVGALSDAWIGFFVGSFIGFWSGAFVLSPLVIFTFDNLDAPSDNSKTLSVDLRELYGDYTAKTKSPEWELTVANLLVGSRCDGGCIAVASDQVYFEIGLSFPAVAYWPVSLARPHIDEEFSLTIDRYNHDEHLVIVSPVFD